MTAYIARRIGWTLVVLWLVTLIVFTMIRALPGDALLVKVGEVGRLPPEQLEKARHELGLDQSKPEQYFRWLGGLVQFDLGHSLIFDDLTVAKRLRDSLPVSIENAILASLVALVIAIPVGVLSAVKQDSLLDNGARLFAVSGIAFPSFWVGTVVILLLGRWLQYFPPTGYAYFWDDPLKNLEQHYLPALILGYGLSSTLARLLRSTVLEVLRQDYVRTARAKGLREQTVLARHVLRNSLIPVITLYGNQFAFLLGGSLIMEILFGLPGSGSLTYQAVVQRDYTQVQGNTLTFAAIIVTLNLVVDVSYAYLDPRIRYGRAG